MQTSGTPLAPTKSGWHLIGFANGDVAVVRWDNGAFQWGSITPPASPITGITYLGTQASGLYAALQPLIRSMSSVAQATVVASLDHGNLMRGQPLLVDASKPASQQSPGTGSEANPTNILPSPIPATAGTGGHIGIPSLSGIFGDVHTWIRIGEALLGALLLFLGLRSVVGQAA